MIFATEARCVITATTITTVTEEAGEVAARDLDDAASPHRAKCGGHEGNQSPPYEDSDWFLAQLASMSVTVADNTMASRYEARIDGALAGVSEYDLTPDTIVFLHTVVAQKYEGQGVGGAIARYALDDARARGLLVRALCPFIRGWMERHPEYSDLVPSAD